MFVNQSIHLNIQRQGICQHDTLKHKCKSTQHFTNLDEVSVLLLVEWRLGFGPRDARWKGRQAA